MGFFDKMKNLFMDEEDEPVRSEVTQVEIPAPVKKEEVVTDNETIKKEEKVNTPIFFDDNYFKELEQPKKEVKSSYLKESVRSERVKEEKKLFKPTPIISPVYGVLDKNYNKEDITVKQDKNVYHTNTTVTIDEIRKKAFGTLEDDLENTLFGNNSILFNDVVEKKEEDLFEDLTNFEEDEVVKIELKEVEESKDIDIIEEDEKEPILESELFDLIDSMYEKGE